MFCRRRGAPTWRRNFSYRLLAVAMMKNDEILGQDPGRRMEKRRPTDLRKETYWDHRDWL